MENLLDVHQVAAIMRIHHKKVQRLARTGVLPCIKVGAVYRFRQGALEGWIEVSERKSTKARPELGVSLPPGHSPKAEDVVCVGIPDAGVRQGGTSDFSIYVKRP